MIEISPTYRPSIPKLIHEKEGNLNLLIHPSKPVWMVVNDLGERVVKLGEEGLILSEIGKIISNTYGVERKKVDQDIIDFFQKLDSTGFLEQPPQYHYRPTLKSLFLHLTNRCNLSCKHCYVYQAQDNGEMDTKAVFSLIDQLATQGGSAITISGGEPLLREDIKEILSYAGEKMSVRLLTNGILIDKSIVQIMSRLGIHVQVSLDGSNAYIHDQIRGKGTFSQVMKDIRLLQEGGLKNRINFCTTIMKHNLKNISQIIELANELSIRYVRFLPLRRVGRARDLWDEINADVGIKEYENLYEYIFSQAIKNYPSIEISSGLSGFVLSVPKDEPSGIWCPIGKNLVITAQGDCYPCVLFMSDEYYLGNVREKTLMQIWESTVMQSLIANVEKRKSSIEKCSTCSWRNFCQGGCMGLAKEWKGTIWDTDEFCAFRKKLYRKSIFELAAKKCSLPLKSEECF
jgi:radical SAM protein with 4Fe4S-binding SPASM domain